MDALLRPCRRESGHFAGSVVRGTLAYTMMTDPVRTFLLLKAAERSDRKVRDLELWRTWMENGKRPEHLEPLLQSFAPVLNRKAQQWRAPNVAPAAFGAELQRQFVGALERYDPSKGAALNTHVEIYVQKAKRYNNRHQNMAYIPEGQAGFIGKIDRAHDELREELGAEPTLGQVAGRLGLPLARVERIQSARRRDIPASAFETDPTELGGSYEEQQLSVARHLAPQLFPHPDMQRMFHLTFPAEGQAAVTSTSELARRLGKSSSQVSRMKTEMGQTLRERMGLTAAR